MRVDALGSRMKKNYEDRYRISLTRRMPVIVRLDGRAFHTITKNCIKPFDYNITYTMRHAALQLLSQVQGAKLAYTQSDEISLLLIDYDEIETNAFFDYNIQKMCSIIASMTSVSVSLNLNKDVQFDCRVFNIPREEVLNYFRWRYKDWLRNSIQMLAQSLYSHKQLHEKKTAELHEMCFAKGRNWNDLMPEQKNGTMAYRLNKGNSQLVENFDFDIMKDDDFVSGIINYWTNVDI